MCDMKKQMKQFIKDSRNKRLKAYEIETNDILEHYNIEQNVLAGGNSYRQILELIQNGADAILEKPGKKDRICILLTKDALYAANTGAPISTKGVGALLSAYISTKDQNKIGRFGIGFKSLLRFGGKIDIITRDRGVIQFDPEQCRRRIMEQFDVDDAAGLRLAWFSAELSNEDTPVSSFFEWAQTLVRVDTSGISETFKSYLSKEIKEFHAEILLFFDSTVSIELGYVLDDKEYKKQLALEIDEDSTVVLVNGDESTKWRRINKDVEIDNEEALADATHIHARENNGSYPLIWAIPEKSSTSGKFWAFFPLNTETHIPGILNAPWKINNDRSGLVDSGLWNTTLMKAAAGLVIKTIPELATDDDPGKVLDYFPRQCNEDEIAWPLVNAVWGGLKDSKCIPDSTGALRYGHELYRHPEGIGQELVEQWRAITANSLRNSVVHPSTMKGNRRSRLEALAKKIDGEQGDDPSLRPLELEKWFAAVASNDTDTAIKVLSLAVAYKEQCKTGSWVINRRQLEIIPTQNGELVSPDVAVFAPEGVDIPEGRSAVATKLAENEEAKKLLGELGVRELDEEDWLDLLQSKIPSNWWIDDEFNEWNEFWGLITKTPKDIALSFVEENKTTLKVYCTDMTWKSRNDVLLYGRIVNCIDDIYNYEFMVDTNFYKTYQLYLGIMEISDLPERMINHINATQRWRAYWINSYCDICHREYRRNPRNVRITNIAMPIFVKYINLVKDQPKSRITAELISRYKRGEYPKSVQIEHNVQAPCPTMPVPHPIRWLLLEHGTLQLGGRTVRLAAFREYHKHPALRLLPNWEPVWEPKIRLFLKGEGDDEDILPEVTVNDEDKKEFWHGLIEELATEKNLTDDQLTPLWSGAAETGVVPQSINGCQLEEIYITTSPDLARLGRQNGRTVVTLDEEAYELWKKNKAQELAGELEAEYQPVGSEELLIEALPELECVLSDDAKESASCQAVMNLHIGLEGTQQKMVCLLENDVLLIDYAQFNEMPKDDGLSLILTEIASTGWLENSLEQATSTLLNPYRRRREAAQGETLAEKLWLAVGENRQTLLNALGNPGFLDNNCDGIELAELVLKHHGVATLYALRDDLNHLDPPERWNTGPAFSFVDDLGFSSEYAASANPKRYPEELIDGPMALPELHNYQKEVKDGIKDMLNNGKKRRRAVVSLPTGAGKTRVTVESAVEFVLKPKEGRRSVLWVAQSDELCEQAVSSFIRVWRNKGEEKKDLLIFRLWGGNPNPSRQPDDQPLVIVATVQTLDSRMGQDDLKWMLNPGLVVIDECHHAIAPSYTRVINWLNKPNENEQEPPFIGLSATPFRVDNEESRRLARRFSKTCLPDDQEGLYQRLSNHEQGVLSIVTNEVIKRNVDLLPKDQAALDQYKQNNIKDVVEYTNIIQSISNRLASDTDRNQELVEIVQNKLKEGFKSILLFANSVDHANEMAIRLNRQGVAAAAISGKTPMVARRDFIERFQPGGLQVLTNYGVLTAGFDAPKVDMILISRLVYSPVSYMQMLGRGMRGPAMGGTESCLNVTLIDNHARFVHNHPYYYFVNYYNRLKESST